MLLGKQFVSRVIFLKDASYVRHQCKQRLALSGYSMHSSRFHCGDQTLSARKPREEFTGACASREIRVCDGGLEAGSEAEGKRQLQAWSRENQLEWQGSFSSQNPHQWKPSSSKAMAPKPTQTVPPSGDQVFKWPKLWGHLSFKPPQHAEERG